MRVTSDIHNTHWSSCCPSNTYSSRGTSTAPASFNTGANIRRHRRRDQLTHRCQSHWWLLLLIEWNRPISSSQGVTAPPGSAMGEEGPDGVTRIGIGLEAVVIADDRLAVGVLPLLRTIVTPCRNTPPQSKLCRRVDHPDSHMAVEARRAVKGPQSSDLR